MNGISKYEAGKVDHAFSAYCGMCGYEFDDKKDIENEYDVGVQVNAIRYLNKLVYLGIISKPKKKERK